MAPTWFTLNYLIRPALRVKRWPVGETLCPSST